MNDSTLINILCFAIVVVGLLCFICGYFFGKSDGIGQTSTEWQKHLKQYIDPYIDCLKEQTRFYKENSFLREKQN